DQDVLRDQCDDVLGWLVLFGTHPNRKRAAREVVDPDEVSLSQTRMTGLERNCAWPSMVVSQQLDLGSFYEIGGCDFNRLYQQFRSSMDNQEQWKAPLLLKTGSANPLARVNVDSIGLHFSSPISRPVGDLSSPPI